MSPEGNWDSGGCKVQGLGKILTAHSGGNSKLRTVFLKLKQTPVHNMNFIFLAIGYICVGITLLLKSREFCGQKSNIIAALRPTDIGLSSLRINAPCVIFKLTP